MLHCYWRVQGLLQWSRSIFPNRNRPRATSDTLRRFWVNAQRRHQLILLQYQLLDKEYTWSVGTHIQLVRVKSLDLPILNSVASLLQAKHCRDQKRKFAFTHNRCTEAWSIEASQGLEYRCTGSPSEGCKFGWKSGRCNDP